MSLKAMAAVWEDSHARGNNRLVLLAIADVAGDDGAGCYYRQEKIAAKAGISIRTLQRCVAELIEADELRVNRENTRTTNDYIVVVAWKRAVAGVGEQKQNTRQVDVSGREGVETDENCAGNPSSLRVENTTHDKVAAVVQIATPANVGGSDTPTGGGSDPFLIRSLPAGATDVKLTCVEPPPRRGSIIPRGGNLAWARQMDRQHGHCHPEICNWRDSKVRQCMPLALVDTYARKLTALPGDAAIANVIAWARADAPPAEYVAAGDIYAHWRLRWDLTRATAPGARAAARGEEPSRVVPGAKATDALLDEMTGGRVRA